LKSTSLVRSWAVLVVVVSMCACTSAKRSACRPGQQAQPHADLVDPRAGLSAYTHSHNDYVHARPLYDALASHIASVEADVYLREGRFIVAHTNDPTLSRGTLESLYLDPLAGWLTAQGGRVYDDQAVFTLVIDIKEPHPDLPRALHDLLDRYTFLTDYSDDHVTRGAVDVILSGDLDMKRAVLDFPRRRAARDSNEYDLTDAPTTDHRLVAYALEWNDYFAWQGEGAMTSDERETLDCLVENAGAGGRSLRFFDAPDQPESWSLQIDAGVRFISSDLLVVPQ
jgi:hypothetical protein